jgi:NTP pyrophosphatase (non-canonical NTP hydrolase)
MDFDSYTYEARKTAIYDRTEPMSYLVPALCAEAGEIAGKWAKHLRDGTPFNPLLELGDIQWMVAMIADEHGYSLAEIAEKNIEKLRNRRERGQLQGSGDER